MERVIITGGTGSIGSAFIEEYKNQYEIYNISRDEFLQFELKRKYPSVNNLIGSIEDENFMFRAFEKIQPNIVVHLAAIKHIGKAEENPIHTCGVNVIGSLNVLKASIRNNVNICVGMSTDKACKPTGCYGYTKSLMEKCFLEANNDNGTKFALCRFANVAHSNGSVIPIWLELKSKGLPLRITDISMNRLMFSLRDAAKFIDRTISLCKSGNGGFIGVKGNMKTVNIYDISKEISENIEIIGKVTDKEKIDEDLVGEEELPFTYIIDDDYIMIKNEKNPNEANTLKDPINCGNSEGMEREEIRKLIYG